MDEPGPPATPGSRSPSERNDDDTDEDNKVETPSEKQLWYQMTKEPFNWYYRSGSQLYCKGHCKGNGKNKPALLEANDAFELLSAAITEWKREKTAGVYEPKAGDGGAEPGAGQKRKRPKGGPEQGDIDDEGNGGWKGPSLQAL